MINNYVIGIQTFVKLDTLKKLVKSLLKCYGIDKYKIIFFIDSINNSLYTNKIDWIEKNNNVKKYLEEIALAFNKYNIEIYSSSRNIGCYKACVELIDICMNYSDYIIFLEDDVILGQDALLYYEKVYEQYINNNIYPCLEAVCSSTWRQNSTENRLTCLKQDNNLDKTLQSLETFNWLHSYEFAITKNIWNKYREIRGSPRGDELLGYEFQKHNKHAILPVIGRSCRIGYNHRDGFSTYYGQISKISEDISEIPESDYFLHSTSIYNLLNFSCL